MLVCAACSYSHLMRRRQHHDIIGNVHRLFFTMTHAATLLPGLVCVGHCSSLFSAPSFAAAARVLCVSPRQRVFAPAADNKLFDFCSAAKVHASACARMRPRICRAPAREPPTRAIASARGPWHCPAAAP